MLPVLLALVMSGSCSVASPLPLEGASASRWASREGWVGKVPDTYRVREEAGRLVFEATGAGSEMPWQITLRPEENSGDARYLLVRYRAQGLDTPPGNYFAHGWEGTYGGVPLARSSEVMPDGEWHTLAVDLARIMPTGDITQLALKVVVGDQGTATLTVERLWFSDELPPGTVVSDTATRQGRWQTAEWDRMPGLQAQPGWTQQPAAEYGVSGTGSGREFWARGPGKGMRWTASLPEAVDLAALRYFAVRYRAWGELSTSTYAIWLGEDPGGMGKHSTIPLPASDLAVDGEWHTYATQVQAPFGATQLAVGLDSAGEEARLELADITFGVAPPRWPVQVSLPYQTRQAPWPAGQDDLTALPPAAGGQPSLFVAQRLGLSDWFSSPEVTVGGIPFQVPGDLAEVQQTGVTRQGALRVPLQANTSEVYLLTAVMAPASEPWGIDAAHPRTVERLSEPEKVVCEIRYADGAADFMLPVDVQNGKWGLRRGLGVHVVHPDRNRLALELLVHDRLETGALAVLGATARRGEPQVAEPDWEGLCYPEPPAGALARAGGLVADLTGGQLTLRTATGAGGLSTETGLPFEVEVDGAVIPAAQWQVSEPVARGAVREITYECAAPGLRAVLECEAAGPDRVRLRLRLDNISPAPRVATLRFPVMRGVRFGTPRDTWYLFGKRGGLINREPVRFREALGETHPLQMDGFFGPASGLALACLTHDTVAQHHFIGMAKTAEGGEWWPEYVKRDLPPGGSFQATEAELALREGDWRAIFAAYREWLATWYQPPADKPWWRRTMVFLTGNAHYDQSADPLVRGAIQPRIENALKYLGACDYMHLFGWASTPQWGEWADYHHYDETVGGLERFRGNIAAAQDQGVGVGLYLDAYLSSEKGQAVGAHAREWAMKRPDGSPNEVPEFQAFNQCPYNAGWRQYLADTYRRLREETGARGLYIDEYGATDGRWTCYATDHGHNGYEVPYAGEVATIRAIREAVGPETALYTEYPPAEVSRQCLDGSFTYQALWSADQEPLAPHFIDLPRFAFPRFKQFHIIYYVAARAGNWWLLKVPFFNGECYDIGEPNLPGFDEAALAFQRRAVQVQCAHREAFSSDRVEPLVPTEVPGVFANRFEGETETVWTLYNANGRTVRAPCLRVPHVAGASYVNAWQERPLSPRIAGNMALLAVELGPKEVGCVVQRRR